MPDLFLRKEVVELLEKEMEHYMVALKAELDRSDTVQQLVFEVRRLRVLEAKVVAKAGENGHQNGANGAAKPRMKGF